MKTPKTNWTKLAVAFAPLTPTGCFFSPDGAVYAPDGALLVPPSKSETDPSSQARTGNKRTGAHSPAPRVKFA